MLNPDLWYGENSWYGIGSKSLYLTWLCCSVRNGFGEPDCRYPS